MSRTPGSGWGAGPLLYQVHKKCGKKKAYFCWNDYGGPSFKCTHCKDTFGHHERFDDSELIREKYPR